jgi:hypothetical protein
MERKIKNSLPIREGIQVGGLTLWFEDLYHRSSIAAPPSHQKFLVHDQAEVSIASVFYHGATLVLEQGELTRQAKWTKLLCRNEIWELWLGANGDFVFANPRQELYRQIVIPQDFSRGVLKGDFRQTQEQKVPLLPQDLEIVFFVNWLANFGDVILHACGFARDGKGFVFTGPSGVGKSTLAAALSKDPSLTILGEDQVLLRRIEDRFWIFGTPWHVNSDLCSPLGVPLEKVFFLERKGINDTRRLTPAEGVLRLLQTAFIPYYRSDALEQILARMSLLAEEIPFHSLSYLLGEDIDNIVKMA